MRGITLEGFAYGLIDTAYQRNGQLPKVHTAISDRLSKEDARLLIDSEELLLAKGWIEKQSDGTCTLTATGLNEVETRRSTTTA